MVGTTTRRASRRCDAARAEQDAQVRDAIGLALAIAGPARPMRPTRLAAVDALAAASTPRRAMPWTALIAVEQDAAVLAAAQAALGDIERKVENNRPAETLFFGLSLGSVLVLAAIGLAITFGVMGVINMAHGELIMIGAYTTYLVQLALPAPSTIRCSWPSRRPSWSPGCSASPSSAA
jgi:urea transport system permease protein